MDLTSDMGRSSSESSMVSSTCGESQDFNEDTEYLIRADLTKTPARSR